MTAPTEPTNPCEECRWFRSGAERHLSGDKCVNIYVFYSHPKFNRTSTLSNCGPSGKYWEPVTTGAKTP